MGKYIAFVALGVLLLVLGIANCKGDLSSIHWYNRRKVSDADAPEYGKWIGAGTIVCGGALLITALLEILLQPPLVEIVILVGFAIGLALMLYGQFKYNKGLF